jgi:formamidopyrimidine-DNA glycosylase
MPELPEVETVARGLRAVLPGRRILGVRLGKTDFVDDPAALEEQLPGTTVSGIRRFGKFLVVDLQRDIHKAEELSLLIHLGMTGQIIVCPPEAPIPAHTHVFIALDDGRELRYTDVRRFGRMAMLSNGAHERVLGGLGAEPLEVSEADFCQRIQSRSAHIKALLLNQSVLRGIGNIYADESLWRAKIHPKKLGSKLSDDEIRRLHRAVQSVLTEAIRMRGSSISDYVDSAGEKGEYQSRHRVYQRHSKKCFRCRTPIRRMIVAGRSSHFCPRCQPAPRQRAAKSVPRRETRKSGSRHKKRKSS